MPSAITCVDEHTTCPKLKAQLESKGGTCSTDLGILLKNTTDHGAPYLTQHNAHTRTHMPLRPSAHCGAWCKLLLRGTAGKHLRDECCASCMARPATASPNSSTPSACGSPCYKCVAMLTKNMLLSKSGKAIDDDTAVASCRSFGLECSAFSCAKCVRVLILILSGSRMCVYYLCVW